MNGIGPTQTIIGWLCPNYFKVVGFEIIQILYKRNSITSTFIFSIYTIILSQSFDLARWWILDSAHVMRQMELNADSGIKDFFLIVERPKGMVEYSGSLPLEQVVEMLKAKMVHEGTTDVSR